MERTHPRGRDGSDNGSEAGIDGGEAIGVQLSG